MQRVFSIVLVTLFWSASAMAGTNSIPVRGLYLMAPKPAEVSLLTQFIRQALPKEGVNVLVLEFDYRYEYTSHPEVVDADALSNTDVKSIVAACREAGVRLIPLINQLGHQSWAEQTYGLLRSHPEFDESPGKFPQNKGIYCRSFCPLHPDVHKVVFDLVDELAAACEADAVHMGMDEVFILSDPDCPRCKSRNRAELFAQEVRTLHDHLAATHREMWMWGDRFIDGATSGLGEWEASENGTAFAINLVPRDIVICDWHYDSVPATAVRFAVEGFRVLYAPWRLTPVALGELDLVHAVRSHGDATIAPRMLGVLQTSWGSSDGFIKAYNGDRSAAKEDAEAAYTFKALFNTIRSLP